MPPTDQPASAGRRVTAPELLAPAGEPRALRAALSAGADAVYFGLARWSARAFAGNFAGEAAPEAVETAHLYDARAYLALNTLLKDDEVEPALAALEAPYLAGLDALIVADLGFAARVREEYPELPLHASTQLNTHSSAQLEALRRLGFSRAILARELSLAEIAALETRGLELEAFVHGALCYGYSGDCLLSSMVGGRSGNRGRCSQSCRLRYALRRTGSAALEPSRIMSTSDLSALGVLPELLAAGVSSFKVEGRMKDAAYVGVTTAVYREALDAAVADPEGYRRAPRVERAARAELLALLHHGAPPGAPRRGAQRRPRRAPRRPRRPREHDRRGDRLRGGQAEQARQPRATSSTCTRRGARRSRGGWRRAATRASRCACASASPSRTASSGWRPRDVGELGRDLVTGRVALRPLELRMRLTGEVGSPAALAVTESHSGHSVTVATAEPLAAARTAALTEARAEDALGALGGTPYRLAGLEFAVAGEVFLAVGELKDLRRRAVAALGERRLAAGRRSAGRAAHGSGGAAGPDARQRLDRRARRAPPRRPAADRRRSS